MYYRNIIIALGFFIFITPFMGIPQSWKDIALACMGVGVIALAYLSNRSRAVHSS